MLIIPWVESRLTYIVVSDVELLDHLDDLALATQKSFVYP
jgi:hypothetical protein